MLLSRRHDPHIPDVRFLLEFSKTHQPPYILRFLGQHSLQHRDGDIAVWHTSRADLTPVPIPEFLDPNASPLREAAEGIG